jgi:hypothetical protein
MIVVNHTSNWFCQHKKLSFTLFLYNFYGGYVRDIIIGTNIIIKKFIYRPWNCEINVAYVANNI